MLKICIPFVVVCFFFFNDTATTEIYTLSLHDALPISCTARCMGPATRVHRVSPAHSRCARGPSPTAFTCMASRSEEHTSELQSLAYLVCRLLLEKKNRHPKQARKQTPDA